MNDGELLRLYALAAQGDTRALEQLVQECWRARANERGNLARLTAYKPEARSELDSLMAAHGPGGPTQ